MFFFIGKTSLVIQICTLSEKRGKGGGGVGCVKSRTQTTRKNTYDIEVHCLARVLCDNNIY